MTAAKPHSRAVPVGRFPDDPRTRPTGPRRTGGTTPAMKLRNDLIHRRDTQPLSSGERETVNAEIARLDRRISEGSTTGDPLPKLYQVEYLVRGPELSPEERTHFDGPDPTRTGSATVLVENPHQLVSVLARFFGHGPGETVEVKSSRVIADDVYTVLGGYSKESTGIERPKHATKGAKAAGAKKAGKGQKVTRKERAEAKVQAKKDKAAKVAADKKAKADAKKE